MNIKITKTAKDTIIAVIVLLVITLVCIVLLSVANEYLKYVPKLDEKTATKINTLTPSGVDDETAFNDGYFKLYSEAELLEKGFDLNKFNKEKATASNKVLAIYRAEKGDNEGAFIVESTAKGYYDMTLLTAFEKTGEIIGVVAKQCTEDEFTGQVFNQDRFEKFLSQVVGQKSVPSDSEVIATTGATTKRSVKGLVNAVSVATRVMEQLLPLTEKFGGAN